MKIMTNARVNSMQAQIRVQALAIKFLKEENREQAERIAELEALLYSAGVLDKDAALASKEERAWFASLRLNGVDERTREREDRPLSGPAGHLSPTRGEARDTGEGNGGAE